MRTIVHAYHSTCVLTRVLPGRPRRGVIRTAVSVYLIIFCNVAQNHIYEATANMAEQPDILAAARKLRKFRKPSQKPPKFVVTRSNQCPDAPPAATQNETA